MKRAKIAYEAYATQYAKNHLDSVIIAFEDLPRDEQIAWQECASTIAQDTINTVTTADLKALRDEAEQTEMELGEETALGQFMRAIS